MLRGNGIHSQTLLKEDVHMTKLAQRTTHQNSPQRFERLHWTNGCEKRSGRLQLQSVYFECWKPDEC